MEICTITCYTAIIILIIILTCTDFYSIVPYNNECYKNTTESIQNINNLKATGNLNHYINKRKDPNSNFEIIETRKFKEEESKYPSYSNAFPDILTGFYNNLCNNQFTKRYMYNAIPPNTNSNINLRGNPVQFYNPNYEKTGIFSQSSLVGNYINQRGCKASNTVNSVPLEIN